MWQNAAPQALGFAGFYRGAYSYHYHSPWIKPFDVARNYPDLGGRFAKAVGNATIEVESVLLDQRDLDWSTILKRSFEAFIRGERPNMYGEWMVW